MVKKRKQSYKAYSMAYNKQAKKMAKKGLSMRSEKLSKMEFEAMYDTMKSDLLFDVMEGKRKAVGNVNQYIVRSQAYGKSIKQSRILRAAAEKIEDEQFEKEKMEAIEEATKKGVDFNEVTFNKRRKRVRLVDVRTGNVNFDVLKEYRNQLIKDYVETSLSVDYKDLLKKERNKTLTYDEKKVLKIARSNAYKIIAEEYMGGSPK